MTRISLALVVALGCSGSHKDTGGGSGGAGSSPTCDEIKAHVEALYRAEPGATDEIVGDNVAMVLAECARTPATVAPCARGASAALELEQRCLKPLDDEGSEGLELER
jgi:hypothetical protein